MKKWTVYFLLAGCLLLSSCGDRAASSQVQKQGGFKPKLDVAWKVNGTTLTVDVTTDMHISPEHYGQARKAGEGHIHMYLDNGDKIGVKENRYEFPDLQPGPHTLKVSLHNNDHTPYDVTQTIDFEIE
ncbi:hypothetical protein [Cohnella caldifontis]|uniref:hypothetical protein n=1 Tax=Cohnella caldifontis TaxID=3027471 RepID=UPI0023ED5AC0|nr:hypothetical protein [Cohnella sp. YIM B05605]